MAGALVICADTSFLFSLYNVDAHSPAARAELAGLTGSVSLTAFNRYELTNALHLAEFRGVIPPGQATACLGAFEADQRNGTLAFPRLGLAAALARAGRLSAKRSLSNGYRSFDVLHVAAALQLGAREFLSFDANQRTLAQAEGLSARP